MFKLNPDPTFRASVAISVPGSDKPQTIAVDFKHLPKSALRDYFSGIEGKTDGEALGAIIAGWSGVDTDYSPEALDLLLDNYPTAAAELFDAYRRELLDASRKN